MDLLSLSTNGFIVSAADIILSTEFISPINGILSENIEITGEISFEKNLVGEISCN